MNNNPIDKNRILFGKILIYIALLIILIHILLYGVYQSTGDRLIYGQAALIRIWITLFLLTIGVLFIIKEILKKY